MQPSPPVDAYAVIFSSELSDNTEDYAEAAARMETLAQAQPGFLGIHTVRQGNQGVSVSYWSDLTAIRAWRSQSEHLLAQERGRNGWYRRYRVAVTRIERSYQKGHDD